ncbi:wax ester/triacylglycerol synthase family O-acyltransferase [Pseudomaricurvus alkylphenolicus]|jgi:WS/DGAT/MGAT family acyltransferase|uniref:wax ester/triacylglycerol synthase family O-acyltransferase n=1 Tax=Pseudomaricurvus alkylphenolicus TaxID=1306991 RepID=UPI00141E1C2B|nr:wax ester/triacylglycerol synthase family O-acyltransferase [Pseudomaricurvus alkylphenolicus]NIB43559.1 wax ester/triacylglycerol synthase family O-acyltransferase [Pseudomaricurvus alkylphenolicus]
MKQLTALDAGFWYAETPYQPMTIAGLWICDQSSAPGGLVRHKQVLEYLEDKLLSNPMFRRRLQKAPMGLDDPYWMDDDNFDLEYHVRHVGLPQPGDWRQLCIFTARIMSRTLDLDRAPWEIYIIEGLNNVEGYPENSFAVLLRMHHAYADGKTGVVLTTALMEDQPTYEAGGQRHVPLLERAPSKREMWARTTPRLFGQAVRSIKHGATVGRKTVQLVSRLRGDAKPDQSRAPDCRFNVNVTPHRTYGALRWQLSDLKKARKLLPDTSVNNIIIAIIAGGMRRYLERHDQLPESSLVSLCPVSVRESGQEQDAGNKVSGMLIGIGTDIADPVERLGKINQRTAKGIPLARDVVADLVESGGEMMPAYLRSLSNRLLNSVRINTKLRLFNTIITNVPGPTGASQYYFAGAPVKSSFPLVPVVDSVAVSHGISGVGSELCLGVLADRAVLEDMSFYIECMQASTDEYFELAAALTKKSA